MTRRNRFICNAILLTAAAFGMRGVGMLFNIFLTARLGASGLGRFSLIMSVYGFAVTLASAGVGLAVTRVVSEAADRPDAFARVRCAVRTGIGYSLLLGGASMLLLVLLSDSIGTFWLHDPDSIPALRLLAVSLPFLSLSVTLNGYFIAVRKAVFGAAVNVCGQLIRIAVTVLLFYMKPDRDGMDTNLALVVGCVVSEAVGAVFSVVLFLCDYRCMRRSHASEIPVCDSDRMRRTALYVMKIAVPIAITACIRSGLQTLLHLLIPIGLKKSGIGERAALAVYGTVHGMVMPVLLFPAALLQSAASLLIPEIAEFRAKGDTASIERWAARILRTTVCFAVFTSGVILCCADTLGSVLYGSAEAGHDLRLLGAIIPVMYLDTMVDALLKGLDEQLASMRYNILDAAFCVFMAYVLLPLCGSVGYILLLYISEIFNLSLSLSRLLAVTQLRFAVFDWVARPVLAVIAAAVCSVFFMHITQISFRFAGVGVFFVAMMMGIFFGSIMWLTGCRQAKTP